MRLDRRPPALCLEIGGAHQLGQEAGGSTGPIGLGKAAVARSAPPTSPPPRTPPSPTHPPTCAAAPAAPARPAAAAMAQRAFNPRYMALKLAHAAHEAAAAAFGGAGGGAGSLPEALARGVEAYRRQLTSVVWLAGAAMAPTLNSKATRRAAGAWVGGCVGAVAWRVGGAGRHPAPAAAAGGGAPPPERAPRAPPPPPHALVLLRLLVALVYVCCCCCCSSTCCPSHRPATRARTHAPTCPPHPHSRAASPVLWRLCLCGCSRGQRGRCTRAMWWCSTPPTAPHLVECLPPLPPPQQQQQGACRPPSPPPRRGGAAGGS